MMRDQNFEAAMCIRTAALVSCIRNASHGFFGGRQLNSNIKVEPRML